jgi:hypothetical protein
MISILVNLFVGLVSLVIRVVRVKEVVDVKLRAIASVTIIIIIEAIINVALSSIIFACSLLGLFGLVCFFCLAEGVLTGFTL